MKIFTHISYNRWDKYRKRKVQSSKKCEFTEKFCEFINVIINSVQDIWLKSQNFAGFEQCNRKWNSSSIIPELQTGQNLSWCGEFDYIFLSFNHEIGTYTSLSYWLKWWAHAIHLGYLEIDTWWTCIASRWNSHAIPETQLNDTGLE